MVHVPAQNAIPPAQLGLSLNHGSFVPYYEQIVDQVRALIKNNTLTQGRTFCSEGEVARFLDVSKMPVRQAFQKLKAEGLLIIAKGKRPVIGSGRVPWDFQQLRGFSEEMRRRGLTPSAKVLALEIEEPDPETAQALKLTSGERIYRLKRLRFVNRKPVAVVTSHLPARIFAGIDKQNLEKQSLYYVFETVYQRKLHWAEEVIGAVAAGEEEARVLQTSAGSPLLLIKETTYDVLQVPIEYSVSLLRGDRYTASVVSVRKSGQAGSR
ncbi:MAG TPA: GntR family transcriptional regulator [Terriglobales bacterium]|nr:GntR family transcriptional regulator [Terriglobales bacterium]